MDQADEAVLGTRRHQQAARMKMTNGEDGHTHDWQPVGYDKTVNGSYIIIVICRWCRETGIEQWDN